MMPVRGLALAVGLSLAGAAAAAASQNVPDKYPQSLLYSEPVEVIPHVWTAIGATAPSTYENAGHNNNLSFIVTGDGVVVVNSGASYLLSRALHDEIRKRTDQPVRMVINENGQGHAVLGNCYWRDQGVPVIAHADAVPYMREIGADYFARSDSVLRESFAGTALCEPDETFTDSRVIELGDFRIEALYLGPAHSPGDVSVWLPEQGLVIAGDMAFHERMLPVFSVTNTAGWLDSWDNRFEALQATYVIPGHGHPTNMAQVRRYTRDYLVYLRAKAREVLDAGGTLEDAYYVDQSPYAHLDTFEELATRNAGRVFEEVEFE